MWTKTFENNVMNIWDPSRSLNEAPSFVQPFNPANGEDWASEAQATDWADKVIYEAENPPVVEEVVAEELVANQDAISLEPTPEEPAE